MTVILIILELALKDSMGLNSGGVGEKSSRLKLSKVYIRPVLQSSLAII